MNFINEQEKPEVTLEPKGSIKPTHIIVRFKGYERKRRLKYGRDFEKLKTTQEKTQRIAQTIDDTKASLVHSIEDDYASMQREAVEPVLQEYILKNTPKPPKNISVIEIIADEVNEVLNNLPEIKLASQVLSEDELKELFSPLAKQIVTNVYGQMEQNIKNLVEAEIDDSLLAKMASIIDEEAPAALTDEERLNINNSLPANVLSVDPQMIQNIAEQDK